MNRYLIGSLLALAIQASGAATIAHATEAQQILASANGQKYTFIVFYKDPGPATQAMAQTVARHVEASSNEATVAHVDITNPADKALVDQFDVSRAPMPLTVSVAPNGALTGIFARTITAEQLERAIVTRAMAASMKSMQDGKMVFVCIQSTPQPVLPAGVKDFADDPQFMHRVSVVSIHSADATESKFLQELEVNPGAKTATTVLLAPPGALVGKFSLTATKDEMAAALHKAGKCCDDPNCKHNQAGK